MKISVCLIVRNEEDVIATALNSIPDAYEIVVVDTGSSDGTLSICRKFTPHVHGIEWPGDFSVARNYAISQASGNYILMLDADEYLTADAERQIDRYIAKHGETPGAVLITNTDGNDRTKHRMIRFFPNAERYRYRGPVHETLYDGEHPAIGADADIEIIHTGYEKEIYERKNKYERYLRMYKGWLAEHPNDGYMLYQLGKLHYAQHKYAEAYEAFTASILLEQFDRTYFPPLLVQFGYTLKELGMSREAFEFLLPFLDRYPTFPDLPFLMGSLSIECGYLDRIEAYFQRAASIGETTAYSTVAGVGSFKAHYNLGVYYELMGKRLEAVRSYQKAAELGYAPARLKLEELRNAN